MMVTIIYGLADPRDGALRYIGKTSRGLAYRLRGHVRESKRGETRRERWIAKLASAGMRPDIFEIEVVPGDWSDAERFWIAYFRAIGADLVNLTPGGEGATGPKSEAHKAKLSEALKGCAFDHTGLKRSDETRKKIGDAQRGKPKGPQSESHRANHKAAVQGINAGVPWSEARKAAYPNEKRTWTPERREKRAATMAARKANGAKRKDAGTTKTREQKASFNAALADRRAAGWHPRWNPEGGRA